MTLPPTIPLELWRKLLPHAVDSLNLSQSSNLNPLPFLYTEVYGEFNYDKAPMFPTGLQLIIHEKSSQQCPWDPRGVDGWYLGPVKYHYRCHRVFCTKIQLERITDLVSFLPNNESISTVTLLEAAFMATEKLVELIQNFKNFGMTHLVSIQQLVDALQHIVHKHIPTPNVIPQRTIPSSFQTVPQPRVSLHIQTIPQMRLITTENAPKTPNIPSQSSPQNNTLSTHSYSLCKNRRPNPKYANGYAKACLQISIHDTCNAVLDTDSGKMLEYCHLIQKYPEIWTTSMANEFGCFMEGVGTLMPTGSKTMQFIHKSNIPPNKLSHMQELSVIIVH